MYHPLDYHIVFDRIYITKGSYIGSTWQWVYIPNGYWDLQEGKTSKQDKYICTIFKIISNVEELILQTESLPTFVIDVIIRNPQISQWQTHEELW